MRCKPKKRRPLKGAIPANAQQFYLKEEIMTVDSADETITDNFIVNSPKLEYNAKVTDDKLFNVVNSANSNYYVKEQSTVDSNNESRHSIFFHSTVKNEPENCLKKINQTFFVEAKSSYTDTKTWNLKESIKTDPLQVQNSDAEEEIVTDIKGEVDFANYLHKCAVETKGDVSGRNKNKKLLISTAVVDASVLYSSVKNQKRFTPYRPSRLQCPKCKDEQSRALSKNQSKCPVCRSPCEYLCLTCLNYHKSSELLRKHTCQVQVGSFNCPSCEQVFSSKSNLKYHVQCLHAEPRSTPRKSKADYQCKHCNFRTCYAHSLRYHQIHRHKLTYDNKSSACHTCAKCKRVYKHLTNYLKHWRTVCGKKGKPEMRCEHCSFTTVWKSGLARHVSVTHMQSKKERGKD